MNINVSGTEIELITNPYGISSAPIENDFEDSIESVLVKGAWNDDIINFIRENNIKGLYLNYTKGFACDDFSFLAELPQLELLNIIHTPVDAINEVENLTQLKSLSISCHWKKKVDLSKLDCLERCYIHYGKGAESILQCRDLKYLYIDGFKLKSYEILKKLTNIEYLTIANSSFNETETLPRLKHLRKLVLLNCRRLDHLLGIDELNNLEWLTIDGSKKLTSIKEVETLHKLKVLQLSNNKDIDSLSPIKQLTQLKALSFFGDTVFADGDLSFLESFPSLSLVGFAGRKHYTHKPSKAWNWKNYDSDEVAIVRK